MSGRFLDAYCEVFGPEEGRLALQLRLLRGTRGAQRLMLAVLEESIECCWKYAKPYEPRKYHLFRQAYRWIQSRDRTHPFAFENVCDVLGVSATRIRRCISAWRERVEAPSTPRSDDRGGPRTAKFVYTRVRRPRSRRQSISAKEGTGMKETKMKTTEEQRGRLLALKRQQSQERQRRTGEETRAKTEKRLTEVDYVILGYLRKYAEGIHGYELGRVLSHSALHMPSLRLPQLYRILRRLEHAGLVERRVEAGGPRLRCLFTITPCGESSFRRWLMGGRESQVTSDQFLNRLRFADELFPDALLGLIDHVTRACRRDLENLRQEPHCGIDLAPTSNELYAMALGARLAAELSWLEAVRKLVEQSPTAAPEGTGAAQVCVAL